MALYVGLDVGTTTLSAVVLDADTGGLLARNTVGHAAYVPSGKAGRLERVELDLEKLRGLIVQVLAETVAAMSTRREEVHGLGVTGQMHGLALLNPDTTPLRPAITWQDRRVEERLPGEEETYLQRFISLSGGPSAFERMGCLPAAGYLGPTLFWLRLHDQLPPWPAQVCFIPDAAVAFLTGGTPCTDPTNGGSSGMFDIVSPGWHWPVIERLGLPREIFPQVRESGAQAGELLPAAAAKTGLRAGTPVFVALGDNQASFLGSVREPRDSLLINVGTGGQISVLLDTFQRLPGLDTRYFPGGRYLVVGAGSFGGRTYRYLRDFFRQVGVAFFGGSGDEELYEKMTRLAAAVPPGSDGLDCCPVFTGTRIDSSARGRFSGISPQNLTPGHLGRALLEGLAKGFLSLYNQMRPLVGERAYMVGAGNGLRRNCLLAETLARTFGVPLHITAQEEEAAMGAALLAAVGSGGLETWDAAGKLVRYAEAFAPGNKNDSDETSMTAPVLGQGL